MNKVLIRCLFFAFILQACTNSNSSDSENEIPIKKVERRYDLFAEEEELYKDRSKLNLEESFSASKEVLKTSYIEEVENLNNRSTKSFYVYKIRDGQVVKSEDTTSITFPLFFLSEDKLFEGKIFTDSTYVFLTTPEKYEVLKINASINYKWIKDAPLLIIQAL